MADINLEREQERLLQKIETDIRKRSKKVIESAMKNSFTKNGSEVARPLQGL